MFERLLVTLETQGDIKEREEARQPNGRSTELPTTLEHREKRENRKIKGYAGGGYHQI